MLKNLGLALLQGLVVFVIIGLLCLVAKDNFFYRHVALVFGVIAVIVRFISASMMSAFEIRALSKAEAKEVAEKLEREKDNE